MRIMPKILAEISSHYFNATPTPVCSYCEYIQYVYASESTVHCNHCFLISQQPTKDQAIFEIQSFSSPPTRTMLPPLLLVGA